MRRIVMALSAGLVLAAPAYGGGGPATVGLSPLPSGVQAGESWNVTLEIRACSGRMPAEGLRPTLTIRSGDTALRFRAGPTARKGFYRARVVFPRAGRWSYEVDDAYFIRRVHTFGAVHVGAAGAGEAGSSLAIVWPAGGALALGAAALALRRRRRHEG